MVVLEAGQSEGSFSLRPTGSAVPALESFNLKRGSVASGLVLGRAGRALWKLASHTASKCYLADWLWVSLMAHHAIKPH